MNKKLTIAVPSYNRAARLSKSLENLHRLIVKSGFAQVIEVYVSNNGSPDDTTNVISRMKCIYDNSGISFSINNFEENVGFDMNILHCYSSCSSDYLWCLSDDDNIEEEAIIRLMTDIEQHSPNLLFYNFNQHPFHKQNPLITENKVYDATSSDTADAISLMILSPKLSSFVIKVRELELAEVSKNYQFNYMHVALSIQTLIKYGKAFYSNFFIAYPDDDFLDHIDFVPFIINDLQKTVEKILLDYNRENLLLNIKFIQADPLIVSLNYLALFYRGVYVLTPFVKSELYKAIFNELLSLSVGSRKDLKELSKSLARFLIGLIYNKFYLIIKGRRIERMRYT